MDKSIYTPPKMEVMECIIEEGFAASDVFPISDWKPKPF